ncbi:hypothetical protein [Deinococcus roseus]|uniref:Uncharacterized protein n=1 Tax=Deinococcus roseus TaxID=392414 RepID=A0ABQ2DCY1_9DEIO|nr:hypothetical protein [Deinococcus roseus]GGJ52355.1 hypothetical protein GCM10008938_42950 [Deinococcus roseus]
MRLQEVRDFIMVVTTAEEVATLPLHQIDRVEEAAGHPTMALVTMKRHDGEPGRTLTIQETAHCFLERCASLQEALKNRDDAGINHHLAPPLKP